MPTRGQIKQRVAKAKEEAKQALREARAEGKEALQNVLPESEASKAANAAPFNRNRQDRLRYPLEDQDAYKAQVRFRVVELAPLEAAQLGNLDFVNELLSTDKISKLDDKIDKNSGEQTEQDKKKRTELTNKNLEKLKGSGKDSYDNPNAQKKYAGSVTLYLPQAYRINDKVNYNGGAALGTIGAGVEGGLKGGASALDAVGAGLTQGIDSFTSLFQQGSLDREASSLALTKVSQSFAPEGIANGVRAATRVTTNPNLRVLFDDVGIRSIPFAFRLVAKSAKEAMEIEKIIKFFRYQLYPDEIVGQIGGATVSLGYKFPDPFEITTTYGEGSSGRRIGNRFLDAYLTEVDVAYNEQSMGYHADGYPSDVSVQLNFIESKALTRKLVEEGF